MSSLNPDQASIIYVARSFAEEAHYTQNYGDRPYVQHIYDVVRRTVRIGQALPVTPLRMEVITAAAYLHDVIEDTGTDEDILRDVFTHGGTRSELFEPVIKAVKLLSKNLCPPGESYLERVMTCPVAHLVKIADTLSNLSESVRNNDTERVTKYAEQLRILHINPIGSFAHVV